MNQYILAAALATLALPSIAMAAPDAQPAPHAQHDSMKHDGGCPEKKDGEKQSDCCKGMKCCDKMKAASKDAAAPDAHAGHKMTN